MNEKTRDLEELKALGKDLLVKKMFEKLKAEIKNNIDELFALVEHDWNLFKLIIEQCLKVGTYDETRRENISSNSIISFLDEYYNNTDQNANQKKDKIIDLGGPIFNITEYITKCNQPYSTLSIEYIEGYSSELLGEFMQC